MQRPELTPEDRIWLAEQADVLRLSCDFMLHDLFHRDSQSVVERASIVPLWIDGSYVSAGTLLRQIEQKVPYSQIFEQWESRVYQEVERTCRRLSPQDARALIVTAGFHKVTEAEIFDAAGEAVQEAWNALYGDPDDSFDDSFDDDDE
ncbi:TPA: hypothetical protein L5U90_003473 [Pseudomonas aeruginosa]|nr:hypothetical protein [Pseudomonas aeruginosa]